MADKLARLRVRVRRQDGPGLPSRWEEHVVDARNVVTVADLLDELPQLSKRRSAPVVWSSSCNYPVCGSCGMQINRRAGLACGTRVAEAGKKGKLELGPLDGFAVRRDLWVDLGRLERDAARMRAWPHQSDTRSALGAAFARCTDCGCCVDACPEARAGRPFVGAAVIAAVHRANLHADAGRAERSAALTGRGGIEDCGQSQNCIEVCPESIPLDEALGEASRTATGEFWRTLLRRKS